MVHAAGRVQFDFDGSLDLARLLWELADLVEERVVVGPLSRTAAADGALVGWLGPLAEEFRVRRDGEVSDGQRIAAHLRAEATAWADAWRQAVDEQNRRNRAARIQELRDDRSFLEKTWDAVWAGDDSEIQVRSVVPATTPQPPSFTATSSEMRF